LKMLREAERAYKSFGKLIRKLKLLRGYVVTSDASSDRSFVEEMKLWVHGNIVT
jgi:hypothetical protein